MILTEGTQRICLDEVFSMLVLSVITLAFATVAAYLSLNIKDEVFRAAMAFSALVSVLLTLFFAPWLLKLTLVAIPLLLEGFNGWITEKLN